MRFLRLIAIVAALKCGPQDPCAGVVPSVLPAASTPAHVPLDAVPFQDALIGDANGSMFIATTFTSAPINTYALFAYDNTVHALNHFESRFGDTSHPRPLVQRSGFLILGGDGPNLAELHSYNSQGFPLHSTRVSPGIGILTAPDPGGGALLVTFDLFPGGQKTFADPWFIIAQRFLQDGTERAVPTLIASDVLGATGIGATGGFAGGVSETGWTFVIWATTDVPAAETVALHGAWLSPDRTVSAPIELGLITGGGFLDVRPLIGGGVAVGASSNSFPSVFEWIAQLADGATTPSPPGWLASFPFTRLGHVRGNRAYAVLQGAPNWIIGPDAPDCQATVPLTLVSAEGKTCGTLDLPAPTDPRLTCLASISSSALAADGTVIVRTFEQGVDNDGFLRTTAVAASWPQLLR
jgi:hypothetical protein